MKSAIVTEQLCKRYPRHKSIGEVVHHPFQKEYVAALHDISLQLEYGQVLCLLGSNGAGKSTFIRILCSLLLPSGGRALVNGCDVVTQADMVRRSIGYVISDERSFYWRLTGRQNLEFFAALYRMPRRAIGQRIDELLALIGLSDDADKPFKDYSSGTRQKLAIARGLIHDPLILFMDEPTRSLDPAAASHLIHFVKARLANDRGKTIILATHNLQEAELLNQQVAILHRGKLQAFGALPAIQQQVKLHSTYLIKLAPLTPPLLEQIRQLPGVRPAAIPAQSQSNGPLELELDIGEADVPGLLHTIISRGAPVLACYRNPAPLAEVFNACVQAESFS